MNRVVFKVQQIDQRFLYTGTLKGLSVPK